MTKQSDIYADLRPALFSYIREAFDGATDADKVAAYLNTRREFQHNHFVVTNVTTLGNGHTRARGYLQKLDAS